MHGRAALVTMDLLRAEMTRAVQREQRVARIAVVGEIAGLIEQGEDRPKGLTHVRHSHRVKQVANLWIAGNALHAKHALDIVAPTLLLHQALVGQERRRTA